MMLFIGRYSFIFRPELGPKQQATAIYFGHMVIDNSEARSWADSTKHSVTFEAWVIWRHSPLIPASPGSVLRRTEVQTQNICSADLDIKVTPYIFFISSQCRQFDCQPFYICCASPGSLAPLSAADDDLFEHWRHWRGCIEKVFRVRSAFCAATFSPRKFQF